MKKCFQFLFGLMLAGLLIKASEQGKPGDKATGGRTLKVKLHYTGTGTVDEKHKIFVVLFDTPDFVKGGAMPLDVQSATEKDATVTFTALQSSPVYAASSYDPSGGYDGQSGPPPSGASLGMYSKTPGTPEPINIEAGKTVQVEIAFDDKVKMP